MGRFDLLQAKMDNEKIDIIVCKKLFVGVLGLRHGVGALSMSRFSFPAALAAMGFETRTASWPVALGLGRPERGTLEVVPG